MPDEIQIITEPEAKANVDMLIDDGKIEMATEYTAAVDAYLQGVTEGWKRCHQRMKDIGYFKRAE